MKLIFGMQPYFDPNRKTTSKKIEDALKIKKKRKTTSKEMEDDLKKDEWKTTSKKMEEEPINQNLMQRMLSI
jgi:hypothetical protein